MNKNIFKTTKAPSIIWRLPLTPTEKIVLFNLAYFEKDGIIENKTQSLMAYIIGTTQPTIVRCMSNLEKDGWISRRRAFAKSDSYSISWGKISEYCKNSDLMEDIPTGDNDMGTIQKIDENELIETLLSDDELIEFVANKFIETEGEDAYDMFIKLNSVNPKSDEFRVLSNRWKHKWERYITTEKRNSLADKITDIVWRRYYQRYRKEVA